MRKNVWFSLGAACVLGAFGIFVHWLQIVNCFEEETGLYVPGLAGWIFVLLSVAAIVVLAVISWRSFPERKAGLSASTAFGHGGRLGTSAGVVCGVIVCLGGVLVLFSAQSAMYPKAERVLGLLAILSGLGFVLQMRDVRRRAVTATTVFWALLPAVTFCYWLVVCYKENSRNPVIWSFSVSIIALCVITVSFYYASGFLYRKAVPRVALSLMFIGVYFCLAVLPDVMSLGRKLLFIGAAVCQLYMSGLLLDSKNEAHGGESDGDASGQDAGVS